MKTLKDIMILVFAATLIVSVTAYAEVADVLSADEAVTGKLKGEACNESLMPPEPVTETNENLVSQEPVVETGSEKASEMVAAKGKIYKLQELLVPEKIGHDEFGRHGIADKIRKDNFKLYEIGKRIACFHQRKIGNAIVEKNFLNYQFDKETGEFIEKNGAWRDDLPEALPADMLTLEEALSRSDAVREGEILFSTLYYISPDSDVFPLNAMPENPCWAVYIAGEAGYSVVTIIDAITGDFLGNGVPPPASGFSMTGPFTNCVDGWISMYESAEYWFDLFPVSSGNSYSMQFPTLGDLQSYVQNPSMLMFYEIAHGSSGSFMNDCNVFTHASDIHNWMASRPKMLFAFIASCGGMCDTGSGTLSHEFRKGSVQHTTTVGYCDMAVAPCLSNCWSDADDWQNTLFYRMALGNTVKEAFDIANSSYPLCSQSNCMRFEGDPNYRIPTFTNIGSQTSSGTNHIVEFCGMENGQSKHGKAICRGDWQLDPCNWTSSCSTGWEYDPVDFYYGCDANCGN